MLNFERLNTDLGEFLAHRARVPGGWLVFVHYSGSSGLTFVPDEHHRWDGSSLPKPQQPDAEVYDEQMRAQNRRADPYAAGGEPDFPVP